jgi:hypothetical protein
MMGRLEAQENLFYRFRNEDHVPKDHQDKTIERGQSPNQGPLRGATCSQRVWSRLRLVDNWIRKRSKRAYSDGMLSQFLGGFGQTRSFKLGLKRQPLHRPGFR